MDVYTASAPGIYCLVVGQLIMRNETLHLAAAAVRCFRAHGFTNAYSIPVEKSRSSFRG
jgi:hypothetical protein